MKFTKMISFLSLFFSFALLGFSDLGSAKTDKEGYFFEMEEESKQKFLEKLNKIELNDTPKSVVSVLGLPQYDQDMFDKKGNFHARQMIYYIKLWKHGLVSENKDELISLYFDQGDRLEEIYSNIIGVPNRKRQ
ncbi:MAG: hypothetical protein HYS07_00780 [Chlamydiae bacterium]|nr:hypothetical protein [Chlamydiota bacterium]